jgi:preprotein translocase subunit SecA
MMRGLCFAIVDEADSVLVDEAATPLIISGGQRQEAIRNGFIGRRWKRPRMRPRRDYLLREQDQAWRPDGARPRPRP